MKINLNNDFDLINNELNIDIVDTEVGKIIVIDDFLKYPDIFYNFFNKNNLLNLISKNNYFPGKEFNMNETLSIEFNHLIDKYIKKLLNLNYLNNMKHSSYSFRVINKTNSELSFDNILPHVHIPYIIDNNSQYYLNGISNCLYLYNKNKISSGTSFYKENIKVRGGLLKKKIKYIDNKPIFDYDTFNNKKYKYETEYIKKLLLNPMYNADTGHILYKKIYTVESKFNRCIFFPNNIFHNFDINNKYYNNINDMDHNRYSIVGITIYDNQFKINNSDLSYLLNK
jgi:hypothetical protein